MPVRLLSSSVMRWPNGKTVREAIQSWAAQNAQRHPGVLRIGYFGSYARGDWGVGSDVDIIAVVQESDLPFERRAIQWDTLSLPVAADLLVYTLAEWAGMTGRFRRTIDREAVWVFVRNDGP
ncbi:MAG: nucleotidyltransferase domain-containing protein [Chloroflexi bacterium]|nr:nucleotidyltransferase domain-containing protein [Chloroflexota bacterium]